MTYDKDYFIKKFEAIPEEKWITGTFVSGGGCCALGHCGRSFITDSEEASTLVDLFRGKHLSVAEVNDGLFDFKRFGSTPRQRILHALSLLP